MTERGYSENVSIDEGVDAYGTHTKMSFEGDSLIVTKSFDGKSLADRCKALNNATSGERWGEMRKVAEIPMVIYAQASMIKDNKARMQYIKNYLRQNPDFITFNRYMK
jgi:hypothetical protein